MPRTKPFAELAERVMADPERRVQVLSEKRAMEAALALAELREQWGLTRQQSAEDLGGTQATTLRLAHEEDLYLSTLREYVADLGGELEVNAVFPDGKVTLVPVEG